MSNVENKKKYLIFGLLGAGVLLICLFFVFGKSTKEYQIVFNSDGGSNVETQIVKDGETVTKPVDPTRENSVFIGWQYDGKDYDFSQKVTGNITLIAMWNDVEEVAKYDVVFVVNGEEKTLSLSSITDADLNGLGFEEKEGYEIKWYLDGKEYDISTPLTGNISLVGKYEKVIEYTIKFNSNGGTTVASQKVKPNDKVKEPDAIIKEGFIFEGWYLNNIKYDFDTPVTKSITLNAKWSEDPNVKRYEVKFNSDGGSKVDNQRIIENKTATEPKKPTKVDYTFDGWYLDGTKYDFKSKVTKDIELKAKWVEDIKYTVTFDSDGGTSIASVSVKKGEKVAKPIDPKKNNYKFKEWLDEDNGTYDFDKAVTKNIKLTAHYEKNTIVPTPTPTSKPTATPTPTPTPTSKPTPTSTPTPTPTPTITYSLDWQAVSGSVVEQSRIYIKDSNNNILSGKARLYFATVSGYEDVDISSSGILKPSTIYDKTKSYVISVK